MTPLALTIAIGAASFALGALVGYLLGRQPRRRRSSVDLRRDGATRTWRGPGRHRGRQ